MTYYLRLLFILIENRLQILRAVFECLGIHTNYQEAKQPPTGLPRLVVVRSQLNASMRYAAVSDYYFLRRLPVDKLNPPAIVIKPANKEIPLSAPVCGKRAAAFSAALRSAWVADSCVIAPADLSVGD